jgi:hypothetical protein
MKKLTQVELQQQGYQFQNAEVSSIDTIIADDGTLRTYLILSGNGWRINYGGYAVGITNQSATEFQTSAKGTELILRLLTLIGVRSTTELVGKYIRVAVLPAVGEVKIIGNIIEDKWFDIEDFFKPEEKVSEADPETPAEQSVLDAPSAPSMPDELPTANVPAEEQAEENK